MQNRAIAWSPTGWTRRKRLPWSWLRCTISAGPLMTEAAAQTGQAAEDLSFTHAIRVLHRRLPAAGSIPPLKVSQHGSAAS